MLHNELMTQAFMEAYIWPLLALILTGLAGWFIAYSRRLMDAHAAFLSAQTKEKLTDLENQALDAGTAYITNWAPSQASKFHPVIDDWVLRNAAQVALNHGAGILADHGNSPNDVADRILAHLPPEAISTDTTGVKIAAATPVQETPLAPAGEQL